MEAVKKYLGPGVVGFRPGGSARFRRWGWWGFVAYMVSVKSNRFGKVLEDEAALTASGDVGSAGAHVFSKGSIDMAAVNKETNSNSTSWGRGRGVHG